MKTLLVNADGTPPDEFREIVRGGSTEIAEQQADRVVVWEAGRVTVDGRQLRWPDDADELKLLFETAG